MTATVGWKDKARLLSGDGKSCIRTVIPAVTDKLMPVNHSGATLALLLLLPLPNSWLLH